MATVVADSSLHGAPISRVNLVVRDIFDPLPESPFTPVMRFANALHVRSRDATVRSHLLFAPGDAWDLEVAEETARNMRALEFLDPLRIDAEAAGDSVAVTVETRDVWSTLVELNIERVGGEGFGSVAFTEQNLLGLGKEVTLSYRDATEGISRSALYSDPAVGGSRARLRLSASTGSAGITNTYYVGLPFYAIGTPRSVFSEGSRITSVARLYRDGSEVARFDRKEEKVLVTWGEAFRRGEVVSRLSGSFLLNDRRFGPSDLEATAPSEFDGSEENLRIRRLSGRLQHWRPAYVERVHVDRMGAVEDFDLGPALAFEGGYSAGFLGSSAEEGWARVELDAGVDTPAGFGWMRSKAESRFRPRPEELVVRLDARWVNQSLPGQTVVFGALGVSSHRPRRDFQIVFGGLNGLRAFPVLAVAGQQGWRFNVEDRLTLRHAVRGLLRIGFAGFFDLARTWGPGSAGAGWHQAGGIGLRLSMPSIAPAQVLRLDLAWPARPIPAGGAAPVFTIGTRQAF